MSAAEQAANGLKEAKDAAINSKGKKKKKDATAEVAKKTSENLKKLKEIADQDLKTVTLCGVTSAGGKNSCFVAGTLLHTSRGVQQNQNVRCGQLAITRPEGVIAEEKKSPTIDWGVLFHLTLSGTPAVKSYITLLRRWDWLETVQRMSIAKNCVQRLTQCNISII